jgi:heme exporter protein CcmD
MDFDMGKYGFYVWGAYGLTALSLGILVLMSVRAHGQAKKALAALSAAVEKRNAPATAPETLEGQRRVAQNQTPDASH